MFSEFLGVLQHVLECNKCRRDGWMLTWFLKFSSENGLRIPHGPYRCVDSKITIKPSCVIVDERCLLVNRFWPMFLALYRVSAASWSKRCSAALICIIMMSISTLWIRTNVNRRRVESRRRITLPNLRNETLLPKYPTGVVYLIWRSRQISLKVPTCWWDGKPVDWIGSRQVRRLNKRPSIR